MSSSQKAPSFLHRLNRVFLAWLTANVAFIVLLIVVPSPEIKRTAPFIEVKGNRGISYLIKGSQNASNCILWLHGLVSSRYESDAIDEALLDELDAYIVTLDRPGYGESTVSKGQTYESFAQDVLSVADALGVHKFFLVGVSAGGAFSLGVAALHPERLRGILLLSAACADGIGEVASLPERLAFEMIRNRPWIGALLKRYGETYVGGRLSYLVHLKGQTKNLLTRVAAVDVKCVRGKLNNFYVNNVLPESLRQGVSTGVIHDFVLYGYPWSFNVSSVPEKLQAATDIWHSNDDRQVGSSCAYAFKAAMPGADIRVVEEGGHFAYWACNEDNQRKQLTSLVANGLPAVE